MERKILEKDNVISFLTNKLANNNINHQDSPTNADKLRHNCRNFEEFNSSCDNSFPLEQCNEKRSKKRENVIFIGDSMLNNISSRGLSKLKKVTAINNPGATSDVIEEELEATICWKEVLLSEILQLKKYYKLLVFIAHLIYD